MVATVNAVTPALRPASTATLTPQSAEDARVQQAVEQALSEGVP